MYEHDVWDVVMEWKVGNELRGEELYDTDGLRDVVIDIASIDVKQEEVGRIERKLASASWSLLALASLPGLPYDITWIVTRKGREGK